MTLKMIAAGLQVIGLASLTVGVFLWSVPAGLIVAGGVILLTGFALGVER